jgi:hypothetical protein
MGIQRHPEAGRRAVALLATAFVVFIGAVLTAFVVLSFAEQGGWLPWAVWSALFAGVVVLLWAIGDKPERSVAGLKLFGVRPRAKVDPLTVYKFRKRRRRRDRPLGSNSPPTLDSVREAAEVGSVRWVPHGPPPQREPRKKR